MLANAGSIDTDRASRPSFLYALPDEMRFFSEPRRELKVMGRSDCERLQSDPAFPVQHGSSTTTVCIGVGKERAERRAVLLFDYGPPVSAVIVIGFAGGLASDLPPGSLVIAETVLDAATGERFYADQTLLSATEGINLPGVAVRRGMVVTAERVLIRAADKQQVAYATGAAAVDMESAGVASAACARGMPWLAVRVITDSVEDDLPLDFNAFTDLDGNTDRTRVVAATVLRPWKIPALIRLGYRSSFAARNLAGYLQQFLTRLPE